MNPEQNTRYIDQFWDDAILPSLAEYIRIPNKSPLFDPEWASNGYMFEAVEHMVSWVNAQEIPGLDLERN